MKYFLLVVQTDSGVNYIKTNASNKETAINSYCSLYNAPLNAVTDCHEIDLMWWGYSAKTIIKNKLFV